MKAKALKEDRILSKETTQEGSLRILSRTPTIALAEMSIEEWFALPEHPRHRPIGSKAVLSQWDVVLKKQGEALRSFRQVVAAEFRNVFYKVDGHERTRLWASNEVPQPPTVFVQIHQANSRDEFNRLYETFNESVSEPQYDKVIIAMREHDLDLRSKRLRYGYILNALNIALRGVPRAHQDKKRVPPIDVHKAVGVFKDELALLDSLDPQPDVFNNGVVAAALIGLSLDPANCLSFFAKLSAREGSKVDGRMDPVEAVLDYVSMLKNQRSAWIGAAQQDLCGRVIRAMLAWDRFEPEDAEFWFGSKIRTMDFQPLVAAVKNLKCIEAYVEL